MDRTCTRRRARLGLLAVGWVLLSSVTPSLARAQDVAADRGEVSLRALLAFADRNAPALRVAARRMVLADAAREAARPLLHDNPSLELAAGPRLAGAGNSDYDLRAALEQPIEIGGERSARRAIAERTRAQLAGDLERTRLEVHRQLALSYRLAEVAAERSATAADVVQFSEQMLAVAQHRHDAGDVGVIDLRLAQIDAAQAQQAQLLAQQELRSAQLTLSELSGWPIASPPLPQPGLEAPAALPSLESALSAARRRHPELLARRAAVAVAQAQLELEESEAWPTPRIGVELTREGNAAGPDNYVLLGTLALPLPFWQQNQDGRAHARAEAVVARAEEQATAGTLEARIARAHSELRSAAERVQLLATSVAAPLDDTLALLRKGFEAGQFPVYEVAVVRERASAARRDALAAYADYYRALAELEAAVGAPLSITTLPGAAP